MNVVRTPAKKTFDISRRQLITGAASGLLLGSAFPKTAFARDDDDDQGRCADGLCDFPVPIPHINTPPGAHFYFPGPVSGAAWPTDPSGAHPEGRDPSVIFNFKGFIGLADLMLTGTGTDLHTGASVPYQFHTDMRFMHGVFVGTDLFERKASFAFV
ncbi:MAG TPA: hypothetical protein VM912_22635 [Terriglobales bacterium]|nr:hypothetical protein [Terriglobales bacterium]